nr:light-harvesting chlorophyll a/b-binding protein [Hevea brasiliensis]
MVPASSLLPISGNLLLSCQYSSLSLNLHRSATILKWGFNRDKDSSSVTRRTKSQAFRILANPNVSGEGDSKNQVIMVDPLEAKRLAAIQMREIKAKEKLKRRHQIEAINGAWAMIGLTAGLVIEGGTGKSILDQLAGYWSAIFHFFFG